MAAVHRRYARALFEAALGRDRLDEVRSELAEFIAAVGEKGVLRAVLRNPQIDARTKAGLVEELVGDADELVRHFLTLTAEKGRIAEIGEIAREFERLVARHERRLEVELTTAYELSDEETRDLVEQIEEASGRKVDATTSVDPSLIGGLVLQAGSLRLDASVRGRLERLRRELVSSR